MIDVNVYNWLKAEAAIIAITGQRIYPENMPPKPTYPCITYRATNHAIDNVHGGSTGFCRSDYFIDAWSSTQDGAIPLAKAIKDSLKDLTGSFGGITVNQIHLTDWLPTLFEESVEAYRITLIFSIWHGEV